MVGEFCAGCCCPEIPATTAWAGGPWTGSLEVVRVEGLSLGTVVSLVDPYQSVTKLEHVGPEQHDINKSDNCLHWMDLPG